MNEITAGVNWLAVGVGTVVAFLLGWLWYSPKLFGARWAAGVGVDIEGDQPMPVTPMAVQLLGNFLLAWVIGVTAAVNALLTAILIVLTIVAIVAANGMFAQKSGAAIGIECGFIVAMAMVMIVCQGIF